MEIILLSILSALGCLIFICKLIGFRRAVRFQIGIDILLTIGLPALFAISGTFAGMTLAILSGLWVSLILWGMGKLTTTTHVIG